MARQLPAHLSYKSALALLPPAHLTAPIEAVRKVHDRHFERWPPHINLLYPFLASPSTTTEQGDRAQLKEEIRARIQHVVKSIQPFHISMHADSAGVFSHGKKSKTVWLGPSTQSIQLLQSALQTEFAECDADQRPFKPHLSVGQAHSDKGATAVAEAIKNSVTEHLTHHDEVDAVALDWHVDKVFVIERKGYHGRFEVVDSIELGRDQQ
ncbi:2'-5' RNA ligase superfamily-domain-containing protein [Paraphoma chrysanthemicola]|uniref:2'-5' RNA ligase superfamily-domain-containing protein n=1 Tax=Paraphoma chrysanthemicola TaxID=798071 RepID=A0A8K0VSS8_9PLEO|nr:2'-5' RNA ligase superfamily-domain-containing protein [Paraphoma chrysanthemicola]